MKNLNNLILNILNLNIYVRRSFMLIIDFFSLIFSYVLCLNIIYGINFFSISSSLLIRGTLLALIGICVFISLGQYRSLTRFLMVLTFIDQYLEISFYYIAILIFLS